MELPLCDNCLKMLLRNLSREEIMLLVSMKENNYINPQMSCDEKTLLTLVKGLTPYKIKKILIRLSLVGMIDDTRLLGSNRYFITKTGIRIIIFYTKEIASTMKSNNIKQIEVKETKKKNGNGNRIKR